MVDFPAGAQNDFNDFARGEREAVRPRAPVAQLRMPARVERGRGYVIEWRAYYAAETTLEIVDPAGMVSRWRPPAAGRMQHPADQIGRYGVSLHAHPAPALAGRVAVARQVAFVEVVAPAPQIEIEVPPRIIRGDPVELVWRVLDAEEVMLDRGDGLRLVASEGEERFDPLICGNHIIRVVARGPGGERTEERRLTVAAPPVHLDLPAAINVEAGDDVIVPYAIDNAARVTIGFVGAGTPLEAPCRGRIEAPGVMEDLRLQVRAYAHDGRTIDRIIPVRVRALPVPSIKPELDFLENWRR